MKKVIVTISGYGKFNALINGNDNWNGFLMPYIHINSILDFVDTFNQEQEECWMRFVGTTLHYFDGDDKYEIGVMLIDNALYYNLGYFGLCFEEFKPYCESLTYFEDGKIVTAVRSNVNFDGADFDGEVYYSYTNHNLI